MIFKASQRGHGGNLAVHLMRTDENEHVTLHELRGFVADDLPGAFREAEAVSHGTKCQKYLFSLSLNPPEGEAVPVPMFEDTIERIERRLGLEGQPRAVVFHEKEGRRHAHCVWSRIDPETMTARTLPFFKARLMDVSRDLYLEQGWTMPRGMLDSALRDPTNFTLAEWQQAKRQGIDPRLFKLVVQDCWKRSDGRKAFEKSLEERGLFLARGDRRGFVVLDHDGEVRALPRLLDVKAKEVRTRLGDGDDLPGVEATQKKIGERMTPALRRHVQASREKFRGESDALERRRQEMVKAQREARIILAERQKSEWQEETRQRAARLPKGLRGLWHRITGRYQQVRTQNEAEARNTTERHDGQRQDLIDGHLRARAAMQTQAKDLRRKQAEELLELRGEIGRHLKFARGLDPGSRQNQSRDQSRSVRLSLRLER